MALRLSWLLVVSMAIGAFAGCVQGAEQGTQGRLQPTVGSAFETTFQVRDASTAKPVFLARITVLGDAGPLVAVATDRNGTAPVSVPADARLYEVAAQGYGPLNGSFDRRVAVVVVRLQPLANATDVFAGSGLKFRPVVDLGSRAYLGPSAGTNCQDYQQDADGDCGLGEPSVEVDGLGQVYVTGTCCISDAPPLYVSRDDGMTFTELRSTGGVREAFGIEADLAVDGDGVLYMTDIELAGSFQVTAWDKDGQFLRHMKWPAPPLVDRDWVRADSSGHLFFVYNTGTSTNVYRSVDGGATWSPSPVVTLPYGLGNAVRGIHDDELWILSPGGERRRADYTLDGGQTWKTEATTSLSGPGGFATGAFDEAGNMYVIGYNQSQVFVTRRAPDGIWQEPVKVTPDFGHHQDAWVAAGGPGKVALSWYGTLEEDRDSNWYLFSAVSLDADQPVSHWQIAIADPEPVSVVEIGPDGAIHIAYSKLRPTADNDEEILQYVHSDGVLPLAPTKFLNGPH